MRRPEEASASESDPGFEFTLDRDWRITSITKTAAAWSGSTVQDLVGRDGHEVNPAATTLLAEPIEAALIRGVTSKLENRSTHVPGRWVRIEVAPREDGVRVRFEDITAQVPPDVVHSPRDGPVEIALLDRHGVIVSANALWRASVVELGLELGNSGVGARYVDVCKTVYPPTGTGSFPQRLEELFSGRIPELEATYDQPTPRGTETRQVRITPLRIGETTYFLAVHEDLTERAKVLAALQATSDQLLHAQERERQRIGIELHESTSQHLAALVLGLHNLKRTLGKSAAARKAIDEMAALAQRAANETRVLSFLMNASGEQREGLEASVRRLVEGFGRRTGLMASFEAEGPVDAVSADAQHAVFRVVQEALSNVYRHARATKAAVSLVYQARVLTVRVLDDGQGLERAAAGGEGEVPPLGVGIPAMRARIEQLGGDLWIADGPGATVVIAAIPVGGRTGSLGSAED